MAHVSVQTLAKGDVIIERGSGKPRMTPVTKVEFNACSTHGVHVNRNACYDFTATVEVVQSEGTLSDLRDTVDSDEALENGLGDFESDEEFYAELAELFVKTQ
jgi:hypothetical protein